ncbi:uncharacterized protein [Blastocystis hominis]|uniref:Apyrase n=1 Tax=Blastocystis hominis TaxID=12968 RepID=D8LZ82_BLAHO|nr:uncharacterized protein [Blastocystis hominis]CBK21121.2 unnamed protein product [Blastocystis hominis]|eukprot:XP_012895169.1 uncharacterized protein [Blastocystis hominis]
MVVHPHRVFIFDDTIYLSLQFCHYLLFRLVMKSASYTGREYSSGARVYDDFESDTNVLLDSRKIKQFPKSKYNLKVIVPSLCAVLCMFYVIGHYGSSNESVNLRSSSLKQDGVFDLVIVSDLDKKSRIVESRKGEWKSIMKKGRLLRDNEGRYSIEWKGESTLTGKISEAGRGMELSALTWFRNKLYAFDDRTGIAFEIRGSKAIPRYIMMEGDGNNDKGQKTEWATVKDDKMYAGSFGKEYTNPDGSIKNTNNMWVSVIDSHGQITHEDWTDRYNKLRQAVGCPYPGYMIHEAISWSPHRKQWVILPRRVSKKPYDENEDERRGSNTVILASEDFSEIEVRHITTLTPTRGFSEFKFLPGSKDSVIVALKSEENEEEKTQNSYIMVFNLDGTMLMEETEIPGKMKFEGLEFM